MSEIIHGSYYGMRIYLGMQRTDIESFKTADDAAKYFGDHQRKLATLMLQQVSISIVAVIEILHQKFKNIETLKNIKGQSYDCSLLIRILYFKTIRLTTRNK